MSETSEKDATKMAEQVETANTIKKSQTVDTLRDDEALQVLANHDGDQHWDEAEENRLRRKIDWRLMPVLCMTYCLQYYDKAMLSQAVSIWKSGERRTSCSNHATSRPYSA